jgi:transposase
MSRSRRSFSPEYRVEAAHRVIDGNRRVAEVARELDSNDNVLHKWVRDERRRMAAAGGFGPDPVGGEQLSLMNAPSWFGCGRWWPSSPKTSRS